MVAKILCGTAFVVLLPVLLAIWTRAAQGNIALPAYGWAPLGYAMAACGLGLMAAVCRTSGFWAAAFR